MKIAIVIAKVIFAACIIVGCLLILGSAGALEHDNISILQFVVQELIGFGLFGVAYLVCKVHDILVEIEAERMIERYNKLYK